MKNLEKLGYARIMLDNHIDGLEISKATGYWSDDDERTLNLMYLIKGILSNIKEEDDWIPCSQMPEYDYMDVLVRWHDKREYCKNDYYLFEGYVVKGEWRGLFSDTDISVLEPVEWTYIKPHKKRCENEHNKQTD